MIKITDVSDELTASLGLEVTAPVSEDERTYSKG
jgi:hypothetical protein